MVITAAMLASLVFGVTNHFITDTPDNIAHASAGAWAAPFEITAVGVAVLKLLGTALGAALLRVRASRRTTTAPDQNPEHT